jgi:hypothetical protein
MIKAMTDLPAIAAYLQRIGAEPRSLRVAVVKVAHGSYWTDIATVRIQPDGAVSAPADYKPTDAEAALITQEALAAEWPTSVKLGQGYALPPELQGVDRDDLFELKDTTGRLVMIQQRTTGRDGEKKYVPWTAWSDHQWRRAEPDGPLPLFGLETIGDQTTVFIHEGAKAARAVQRLIAPRTAEEVAALAAHPWGQQLQGAAHLGWIGGALSPARTDWSALAERGVKRVYIVADNDAPGKAAIPKIAQQLRGITTFSVEFTEVWPVSFDLADPWPAKMFAQIGATRHYVGPSFRDLVHPATWATDLVPPPGGKGRPTPVLRKEFADLWLWIEETDTFICRERPEINHQLSLFNAMVAPFSDVSTTGQLLQRSYKGRMARVCYRPDVAARTVTDRNTSAINLHTPTNIAPLPGDTGPWLEFLEYLFPIERERKQVARWCATLIARPEIRMVYALLLVSERQGMGKSTLGERILAPLVGMNNVGFPGERDIVESGFNDWVANKRLIVVGEIYTGHSFKSYNILKHYLTDKSIRVNEKFQRPYTIENWVHMVACSNSKKALRVEESDRRWFYPTLSEVPWKREKWGEFYQWLSSGGLNIIMQWAHDLGDYVNPGEHSPMTAGKAALIEESRGEVLNHWADIMAACEEAEEGLVFALSEVRGSLAKVHSRMFETPLQLKKMALERGWYTSVERVSIDGGLSYVVASPALGEGLKETEIEGDKRATRAWLTGRLMRLGERLREGM